MSERERKRNLNECFFLTISMYREKSTKNIVTIIEKGKKKKKKMKTDACITFD